MRKLSLIFAVLLCILVSCRKQGPMGPKGDPASFDVLVVDVPQKAWVYSDLFDNNYFSATVKMPEITEDVFDEGVIMVYRTYDLRWQEPQPGGSSLRTSQ